MSYEKPTPPKETKIDPAFALRRAIVALSDTLPSHATCVVDQFIRFVTPAMTRDRGVGFPHTCRQHRLDPERCTGTGKYPLLYFHVGNAVLAYYDTLAGEAPVFNTRLALLEEIAVLGMESFTIHGNERIGFTLMSVTEAASRRADEKRAELDKFKAEDMANATLDAVDTNGGLPQDSNVRPVAE